jgi:hypothetical protein
MRKLQFLAFLLLSTLVVGGGSAQNSADKQKDKFGLESKFEYKDEKPVWTLEYIEIKPGVFGPAMGYLDDNWMRVREEAKHDGSVLAFYRVAEAAEPDNTGWRVVLMTEFKNQSACDASEKQFAAILKRLPQNTSEVFRGYQKEQLFQSVGTHTFRDFSESANPQFRLLSKM